MDELDGFKVGDRVELHPATDRWMMGDRYGEVVKITAVYWISVKLDKSGRTQSFSSKNLQHID